MTETPRTYRDPNMALCKEEYKLIFGGELSLADFDTTKPTPNNINKIANEINKYLQYRNKHGNSFSRKE